MSHVHAIRSTIFFCMHVLLGGHPEAGSWLAATFLDFYEQVESRARWFKWISTDEVRAMLVEVGEGEEKEDGYIHTLKLASYYSLVR